MMWPKFVLCCDRYRYIPYWMGCWYCFLFRHKTKKQYTEFEFYQTFSGNIAAFYSTCSGIFGHSISTLSQMCLFFVLLLSL